MSLVGELASLVAETSFGDLPGHIVEAAKMHILDTIGGSYWGRHEGNSGRLVDLVSSFGGSPEATLWGEGRKVPAIWTAFVNGYSSFYISDTDRFCGSHAGAVVVPAALAAGELAGVNGKDLITAVVLGYEVFSRVGLALFPAISRKGFHATGVIGPLGSAAAASKLLGFDRQMTTDALSIATLSGMGLGEAFRYLDAVSLNIGRVSQAGIMAALLAQKGYKGSDTILEGGSFIPDGFLSALVGTYDGHVITGGLGREWKIVNSAPKIHGGCRHLAAPTDVIMAMVVENRIRPEDIEKIRIRQYSEAFRLDRPTVIVRDDAFWSSRFTVSVALLSGGPVYPSMFTDEMVNNEAVRKMMARVTVEADPALDREFPDKWPAEAEIVTGDGMVYHGRIDYPRGEPENEVPVRELIGKLRALAMPDLGSERTTRLIDAIHRLDAIGVDELASIL